MILKLIYRLLKPFIRRCFDMNHLMFLAPSFILCVLCFFVGNKFGRAEGFQRGFKAGEKEFIKKLKSVNNKMLVRK